MNSSDINSSKIPIPPEFLVASKEQQMEFIAQLWNHVAPDSDPVPRADADRRSTNERLAAHHAAPIAGKSLDQVRDELLERFYREALNEKRERHGGH